MDNNGCPTQVLVMEYAGKRIIIQLMFCLSGNNEIDDTQPATKDLAS